MVEVAGIGASARIEEITEEAQRDLATFREAIKQGTIGSQSHMDQAMREEFEEAKKQIEEYRQAQFKKVDASIDGVMDKVVREVLGRAIPLSEHEKLIIEALEEAKREALFAQEESSTEKKEVPAQVSP